MDHLPTLHPPPMPSYTPEGPHLLDVVNLELLRHLNRYLPALNPRCANYSQRIEHPHKYLPPYYWWPGYHAEDGDISYPTWGIMRVSQDVWCLRAIEDPSLKL